MNHLAILLKKKGKKDRTRDREKKRDWKGGVEKGEERRGKEFEGSRIEEKGNKFV